MLYPLMLVLLQMNMVHAISDSSFNNTAKYQKLTIPSIVASETFHVHATFYPPPGKKLNHASYVKIWEKKNNAWIVADEITPGAELGFLSEYHLGKKVLTNDKKSLLAIEVDFIHCDLQGGQCAMERFLGKVSRNNSTGKKDVYLTLRVD